MFDERLKMKKINTSKVKKVYTILLCMYSILQVYYVKIIKFDISLADICLLLILPFCMMLLDFEHIKININMGLLMLYCVIQMIVLLLFNKMDGSAMVSTAHFILILFVLSLLTSNSYLSEKGLDMLVIISTIASIFLIFQFIMINFLNIYISGQVSFLKAKTAVTGKIRPFSFFSEPASYGMYSSFGLAICLFGKDYNKKNVKISAAIITIALMLSMSTTSIGLMCLIWSLWFLKKFKKMKAIHFVEIVAIIIIIVLIGIKFNVFTTIYEHSFEGLSTGQLARGLNGRIGNLDYAWKYHTKMFYKIFGVGIVDLKYFIPAIARIYIYYGMFGYICFGLFFSVFFMKTGSLGRVFILLVIVSSLFSDSIFGAQMFTYMPVIIAECNKNRKKG